MFDMSYVEPQCSICIDSLFDHPVCALPCGHCYHGSCFEEWRVKAKNECPQCKANAGTGLRILQFTVKPDCDQTSLEDVRRLVDCSPTDRANRLLELEAQLVEVSGQLEKARQDEAELWDNARHSKQRRKDLQLEMPVQDKEIIEVQAELTHLMESVAKLQLHVDEETQKQRESLPVPLAREGDDDLAEERRRLRGVRREERLKQLHEALVNALNQEQETLAEQRGRAAERRRWEAESDELRRKASKLKQDLQERRAQEAKQVSARRVRKQVSQASITSSTSHGAHSTVANSISMFEADGTAPSATASSFSRAADGSDGRLLEESVARASSGTSSACATGSTASGAAASAGRSEAVKALAAAAAKAHNSGVGSVGFTNAATSSLSLEVDRVATPAKTSPPPPREATDDSLYSRPLMRKKTANLGALFSGTSAPRNVASLLGGSSAPVEGTKAGLLRTLLSER